MAVGSIQVTIAGSFPPLKGISGYCTSLGKALAGNLQVTGLTFSKMYPGWLYPGGSERDPSQEKAPFPTAASMTWYNPFSWLRAGSGLRCDVLHIQHWSLPLTLPWLTLAMAARLRGRKVVVTLHNTKAQDGGSLLQLSNRLLGMFAHKQVVHAASLVQDLGPLAGRAAVIPHGIMDTFKPSAMTRDQARAGLGLPAEGRTLLFFGSIRPYKGLDDLLAAFRILRAADPSLTLLVAGKPWKSLHLEEEPGVHALLDFIPAEKVPRLFKAADVTVLPYRTFHGQSGVGLTALALGVPLVVTACGGLPELAIRKELTAPCSEPKALAAAIAFALEHREEIQAACREHAALFSWSSIARQTETLYREILDASR